MKVDYPRFSILDPQTTFSLPKYQRADQHGGYFSSMSWSST